MPPFMARGKPNNLPTTAPAPAPTLPDRGGTTERIFEVAKLLVGRVRGGLAYVNVIGSMIFAGMSGSAVADAAGLGVIEIRAMIKEGYTAKFSATISAVSATIGPIIPPSIPFVIYGSLANVSVGALFLAGIIPGLLMGIGLMIAIGLQAKKLNLPVSEGVKFGSEALNTFIKAIPALALPPFILISIFSGIVTPTEAAVVSCVYALFVGTVIEKRLKWRRRVQLAEVRLGSIVWGLFSKTDWVSLVTLLLRQSGGKCPQKAGSHWPRVR
jgi:tripartite ATP-independent transporter DctM subunit